MPACSARYSRMLASTPLINTSSHTATDETSLPTAATVDVVTVGLFAVPPVAVETVDFFRVLSVVAEEEPAALLAADAAGILDMRLFAAADAVVLVTARAGATVEGSASEAELSLLLWLLPLTRLLSQLKSSPASIDVRSHSSGAAGGADGYRSRSIRTSASSCLTRACARRDATCKLTFNMQCCELSYVFHSDLSVPLRHGAVQLLDLGGQTPHQHAVLHELIHLQQRR